MFRFALPVGGLLVDREIVVEPRFTSTLADRLNFTASPLPSDAHLKMLDRIAERVVSARQLGA